MLNLRPLKGLKGLPGLKGLGRPPRVPPLPTLGDQPARVAALADDEVQRLANQLGDEALAKRIVKLKKKWPKMTTLEGVAMDFLERKRITYVFQQSVFGGRRLRFGQVLDFVIDQGSSVLVWETNGRYWHTRPGKEKGDEAQRLALMGTKIWGKRVSAVVTLWDTRIATDNRSKRQQALEAALSGKQLGV